MRTSILSVVVALALLLLSVPVYAEEQGHKMDTTSLRSTVPDTGKRSDNDNGVRETNENPIQDTNVNRSFANINTLRTYDMKDDNNNNWGWLGLLGLIGLAGLRNRGREGSPDRS
ncbi:WGxxGxxG family protein [Cohnella lupini]|uniref:MYXO-CTERM domain-containing protein n=1 Tax=Cohnella lupini TaxID=1294267 RepID=A0A3D9IW75_9BACL|nr:WGxxGxxG family protein [Cohnella lupini]RED65955.1 MYXO-CTERM domain-containing protein [Cohnella lupini]